jgi:hypothetical protein
MIEVLQCQNSYININQKPSDLIFSYTYGLDVDNFAMIVQKMDNTINFYNCSVATTKNYSYDCQSQLTLSISNKIGAASLEYFSGNRSSYFALT